MSSAHHLAAPDGGLPALDGSATLTNGGGTPGLTPAGDAAVPAPPGSDLLALEPSPPYASTDRPHATAPAVAIATESNRPPPLEDGSQQPKRKKKKWPARLKSSAKKFSFQRFLKRFAPTEQGTTVVRRQSGAKDPFDELIDEDGHAHHHQEPLSPATLKRRQSALHPKDNRRVYINAPPHPDSVDARTVFPTNEIRTTKYTLLSFFPRNLWEQFRRIANTYFLLMVVLQFIPVLEIADPSFAALPIIVIVAATAMKDGLEDFRRRVQDKRLNEELTVTLANWSNMNRPLLSWRDRLHKLMPPMLRPLARKAVGRSPVASSSADILSNDMPPLGPVPPPPEKYATAPPVWQTTKWKDVHVGDLVLLRNNDNIPADIVILSTSELDNMCYVETKSLDGETNLKIRRGPAETAWVRSPEDAASIVGVIQCDPPSAALYKFQGTLVVRPPPRRRAARKYGPITDPTVENLVAPVLPASPATAPSPASLGAAAVTADIVAAAAAVPEQNDIDVLSDDNGDDDDDDVSEYGDINDEDEFLRVPLTMTSVLLRGCVVRNSEWVIGMVLFTGPESKIQLNSGETPSKRTRIEKQMNPQVMLNVLILLAMCLVCAITHVLYSSAFNFEAAPFSLEESTSGLLTGIITFFTCVIIFQNLVPISLYVTVEIVKTLQAYFIHVDETMYDEELDRSCSVRSWNLSDDLGQIEYVFSDKTGTLTRNIMELRKTSIAGLVYGDAFVKADPIIQANMLEEFQRRVQAIDTSPTRTITEKPTTFVDLDMVPHLTDPNSKAREFFLLLALCHTVLPEKVTDGDRNETTITYKAQSPDEEALVTAAQSLGITFLNRSQSNMVVSVLGEIKVYDVLEILEFTSHRKRMTVIVRDPDRGVLVLTKGADSVIFERMAPGQNELRRVTLDHLQWFANDGLRTLCVAHRQVSEDEYAAWQSAYQKASVLPVGREDAMDLVAEELEQNLVLLGATAIEDKLQDQVPETIEKLMSAGIKVWVLTGDKVETAIQIGFSCNLLERDMTMIVIQGDDYVSTRRQLQQSLATLLEEDEANEDAAAATGDGTSSSTKDALLARESAATATNPSSNRSVHTLGSEADSSLTQGRTRYALVIDGSSLKYALEKENRLLFLEVGCRCVSVMCCRVSPLQKAQVVALVRKELDCLALSIGDGANDVSMIQEANIGIGIAGKEGMQAAMSSDYAIGQFKFLQQLLLVHGRWSYRRIATMNLTFFYKNIIWTFVLFWYQFYCGFSGSINYEYSYVNYYNLFFTVLPTMLLGVLDQDVTANRALAFPKLYGAGLKQSYYNSAKFWVHILDALYQSLMCYFVGYMIYSDAVVSQVGWGGADNYEVGTAMATFAITTANVYIAMYIRSWSWAMLVGIPANTLLFPLYVWGYSIYSSDSPIAGLDSVLLASAHYWVAIPLAVILCVLPRFMIEYYRVNYYPGDVDLVRQLPIGEVAGDLPPGTVMEHPSAPVSWLQRLWHPHHAHHVYPHAPSPGQPLTAAEGGAAAAPSDGSRILQQPAQYHPTAGAASGALYTVRDEEVELRPRHSPSTRPVGELPAVLVDNLKGTFQTAFDQMRAFGRVQRDRMSRRMGSQSRPSFFLYMGGAQEPAPPSAAAAAVAAAHRHGLAQHPSGAASDSALVGGDGTPGSAMTGADGYGAAGSSAAAAASARPHRQANTGFAFSADEGLPPVIRRQTAARRQNRGGAASSDAVSDSHVELTRSRVNHGAAADGGASPGKRSGHARMFSM
ncbi:hypothetical protein BC828DRAFT_388135 [Blastocladiella britannica]|nr:hypothetical protein BC828DRAFT_388135 [Blastocladiella britannica]